ncbi:MAG: MBL fold metallo-hydrolase [Actinomycetota bacterium]
MARPVADAWFATDEFPDRVTRIREHHVDSYAVGHLWLIAGSDRSVVFDAGSGMVPPAPFVGGLVDTPLVCLASCSGYDHAGGWSSFAHRACHVANAADLADPTEENRELGDWLRLDHFDAVPVAGFEPRQHTMTPAEPTELVIDGQTLDLGDRTLTVLHTPGRSPGGVSLWEASTGLLFSGEVLYDGDHGPAWPPPDPAAYVASLERLRALSVRLVHPGHYGSFSTDRFLALTAEQIADLAARPQHPTPTDV